MINEKIKEYKKAWYAAHREEHKAYMKAYHEAHKDENKAYMKAWHEAHKEHYNEYMTAYNKADVNSIGQTKHSIRIKSRHILKQMNLNISGYEIHHCFTYDDPAKFIYISKALHLKIHKYLREHNIDADTDHYEQIKHLLNEKVFLFK